MIQGNKIYYIYRITNKINGKIYIGQTVQPNKRWNQHCHDSKNPTMTIHYAIKKYGYDSFNYEVIAGCKTLGDVNETERMVINQYNCLVPNGYNVALGGYNAPKSESWKQAMKEWRSSLSEEEKLLIKQKQSEATLQQIATKGHPATGRIVTQEIRDLLRQKRLDNPIEYTDEIRQRMSEAHIGFKISKETRQKKSDAMKLAWKNRTNYDKIKCSAGNCEIKGKAKYRIINNVRYCVKHGLRMSRYGRLERIR